jgi:hypothetical protein
MKPYEFLDLPIPPQHIADVVISFLKEQDNLKAMSEFSRFQSYSGAQKNVEATHNYDKLLNSNNIGMSGEVAEQLYSETLCTFTVLPAPKIVCDWVKENIPEMYHSNQHIHILDICKGTFFFPHVDMMRVKAYNCFIDTGGTSVKTCFYKPKEEFKNLAVTPRTYIPYDRIDLFDYQIFPKNKWHAIDVTKIHSIENIEPGQRRYAITLSVPFPKG